MWSIARAKRRSLELQEIKMFYPCAMSLSDNDVALTCHVRGSWQFASRVIEGEILDCINYKWVRLFQSTKIWIPTILVITSAPYLCSLYKTLQSWMSSVSFFAPTHACCAKAVVSYQ